MTVKELKEMFDGFEDNEELHFYIDESALENLSDSYRYSPIINMPYRDNTGWVLVGISSEYSR